MRKEIIGAQTVAGKHPAEDTWLDLDSIASVRLTSEDPRLPFENALSLNPELNERGWRAATPGPQTIALLFDTPQTIRRIYLHIIEREFERSQEFLLRYSSATETDREIVRQQWSFSPTGSAQEIEDYKVNLESVTRLELILDPDRGTGQSRAALNALRIA